MRATITMGMRPTGGRTRADGRAVGSHLQHSFRGRPFAHSVRPPSVVVVVAAVTWGNIVNFSVTGAACCAEPSASSPPIRARSRRSRRCLGCSLVFFLSWQLHLVVVVKNQRCVHAFRIQRGWYAINTSLSRVSCLASSSSHMHTLFLVLLVGVCPDFRHISDTFLKFTGPSRDWGNTCVRNSPSADHVEIIILR